jgi:hypothetical protein
MRKLVDEIVSDLKKQDYDEKDASKWDDDDLDEDPI